VGGETDAVFEVWKEAMQFERVSAGKAARGSRALRVNGKIFAMMSSKGQFVVRLSEERVSALVADGSGTRFDAGRGRPMKEWLAVTADHQLWVPLAREARTLLGQ
jgi:hypothetical protein